MSEKIKRLSIILAVMFVLTVCTTGILFVWDLIGERTAREIFLSSLWTFVFFYLAAALIIVLTDSRKK